MFLQVPGMRNGRLTPCRASPLVPRMNKTTAIGFPLGLCIGVIVGAVIHNMGIGILLGLALGFGIIKFPVKRDGA